MDNLEPNLTPYTESPLINLPGQQLSSNYLTEPTLFSQPLNSRADSLINPPLLELTPLQESNLATPLSWAEVEAQSTDILGTDSHIVNLEAATSFQPEIQEIVSNKLENFIYNSNFINQIKLSFGEQINLEKAENLIEEFISGETIPELQILPLADLKAQGAYGSGTIYLAKELVQSEDINHLVDNYLEEYGHFLDDQLNPQDSPGDEGAIFAALVENKQLSPPEILVLKQEDDHATLTIDGKTLIVEQAALESGNFTVNASGKVKIDFLADSGAYQGEIAIFSLDGMENLVPGSVEFITEAARRALSNSNNGYLVISDATEGARFDGELGEIDQNIGNYLAVKTFNFTPGTNLALMLVPDGTVKQVLDNPAIEGNQRPLFSLPTANPSQSVQFGQLLAGTINGGTFGFEDLRNDQNSDFDYNDLIFQIKGASGNTTLLQDLVKPEKAWFNTAFGQQIIDYSEATDIFPNQQPSLTANLTNDTGVSNTDKITSNAAITGTITNRPKLVSFSAGFNDTPVANFVDVLAQVGENGQFTFDANQLAQIKGGTLADGTYVLHLIITDNEEIVSTIDVSFTLDTTAPIQPGFILDPTFDSAPLGDSKTTYATVNLLGETESNVTVSLQGSETTANANNNGQFSLTGVNLATGDNSLVVRATDVAGNKSEFTHKIIKVDSDNSNVIVDWNGVLLNAIRNDKTTPPVAARNMAMVHSAVYDAVNSINPTYSSYHFNQTAPTGASAEAAAATAAHDVLVNLYPTQTASFDSALTASLAEIPDGASEDAGVNFGKLVANDILTLRSQDGSNITGSYTPGTDPGDWQPTPPNLAPALLPNWANVTPFAITNASQFRPDGPPALNSTEYATEFNQVKELGRKDSSTRTSEQTQIAKFWADGSGTFTPGGHWNEIAEQISTNQNTNLVETARLFALLNISLADAGIACWDAKYNYNFWRPITAIQQADNDGNDNTIADPNWTPLLITPPFPEYTSGHSTFSGAASTILSGLLGNNISFNTTSLGLPGVGRNFNSFSQAADEAGISRIYGGIHFSSASVEGLATGRELGNYILDKFLVPINDDNQPPVIEVSLVNDTGSSNSDKITNNSDVTGKITDASEIVKFQAKLNSGNFVDVLSKLNPDGSFSLDKATLAQINGGQLPDGTYKLSLLAEDKLGKASGELELGFTLDTTNPVTPSQLSIKDSQTTETSNNKPTIVGQAETGSQVKLFEGQTLIGQTTAVDGKWEITTSQLSDGVKNLTAIATDIAGNVSSSQQLIITIDTATIQQLSVMPGEQLKLESKDIFGKNANFAIESEESLPTGMLDSDGTLIIKPDPSQIGTYDFKLVATDGEQVTTKKFNLAVVADTVTTTRITGVIQNTEQQPLAGVVVRIDNLSSTTATDGSFTLTLTEPPSEGAALIIEPGQQVNGVVYPSIAEKLPLLLEHDVYLNVKNVIDRPIYLPPIDISNAKTIDPSVDQTVTSEAIPGSGVTVFANSLFDQQNQPYTGQLSITEVPTELTPAALPENLRPDLVVTIQPGEMKFTTPAPLSLPNLAGYAPGTQMDLWSINPQTGFFDNVGKGQVSADGKVINTIEGGIRNSSWHFFAPPDPTPNDPKTNPRNPEEGCNGNKATGPSNSDVELYSGAEIETHNLIAYQSLGVSRGLTLRYDSERADARPIVHFGYSNVPSDPNLRLMAELTIKRGDFTLAVPGFAGGQYGLNGGENFWSIPSAGGNVDAALQADLRALSSGRYDYDLTTGLLRFNNNQFNGSTSNSTGKILVVNSVNSAFGSGWGLAGLQELVVNPDGSVMLIDGDGSELLFEKNADNTYKSPAGHFSTLERLGDGTFRHTAKDQTVYSFDAQNKLVDVRDRLNNETRYVYQNGLLSKIVDPVGLETTFTYSGNKITAITDPAGRVTKLTYDTNGNLLKITDPDGTGQTWEYDAEHHMTAGIDQLGNRGQTSYNFAGRVTSAILKDGSQVQFDPIEVQGLYEPNKTNDPLNAPVAFQLGVATSTYTDGNGNKIVNVLDRAGQIVSSSDDVGLLPKVERNTDNLVTKQTDALGNVTAYTYDAKGNVLSVTDGIDAESIISGAIARAGEVDEYTFTGKVGQQIHYDNLLDASINNVYSELYSPSGAQIFSRQAGNDSGPFVLTEAGNYRLVLKGGSSSAIGNYSFRFSDLANAPTLSLGTTITDTLKPGIKTDIYQFTGKAGQRILVDSLVNGVVSGATWSLYGNGSQRLNNTNLGIDFLQTLPTDGTYFLFIDGNLNNNTINYSFRVNDISDPTVSNTGFNTIYSGTIAAGEDTTFTLSASAGLPIFLDGLTLDNQSIYVELRDPLNNIVFSQYGNSDSQATILSRSGDYNVTVRNFSSTSARDYKFRFLNLASDATALTLSTPITETLELAASTRVYSFTGAIGQRLYYDALQNDADVIDVQLISPNGTNVFSGNSESDRSTFTLTEAGTYYLLLKGNNSSSADYSFNLIDASAATAITLGTTITETLTPGLQADIYRINGTAGQQLYFDSLAETSNANWHLYGPGNQYLIATNLSSDFETTLTSTGTYLLVIDGSNSNGNINYSFNITSSFSAPTALTLGTAITSTISQPGEIDEYTFTGAVGQRLYYDGLINNNTSTIYSQLISPSGQTVFSLGDADSDRTPFTLTEAGTYRLILDGQGDNTGNYSFNLIDASAATAITLGTTITETLTPGLQADIYRINGTAGQQLYFDSLAETSNANWHLYGPGNQYLIATNLSSDFETTLTSTGTYLLVIDGSNSNGNINYSFNITSSFSAPTALTLGTAITSTISQPGEIDEYTFTGAVGQRLYYDGLINNNTSTIYSQLISPSGQTVFSLGDADSDRTPFTLTEAGTYRLILDGQGDNTGNYSFNLIDASAATAITLGTTITETLTPGLQADIYRINGTAGQQLYFDSLAETSNANWHLYGPGNQYLIATNLSSDFETTLTSTGTYLLVIDGSNSNGNINYSFNITSSFSAPTALTLGTAITSTISQPGEIDEYTFTGAVGQRLYYDGLINNNTSTIYSQLISPSGQTVFSLGDADSDRTPFTLTEAGTYRLILDGQGDNTGNYSFNLIDASAATAITLGTTITETLTPGLQADIYRINGTAGQQLYFDSLAETSNANWHLYGPGNQYLIATNLSSDFETTLTSTGTYLLVIDGSNSNGNINYSFNITSSFSAPTALTLGTAITSTISQPGEIDEYTFTGAVGQRLYYDGLINNNTSTIYSQLISPSGQTVFSLGDADSDRTPFTLTEAGTYRLILDGQGDNTGNYSFNLIDASAATAITLGTTITETLTPGLQADIYRINGTAGQHLYFDSLITGFASANWYLYDADNKTVTGTNLGSDFTATLPGDGTYVLVLDGYAENSTINYNFKITDISAASVATTGFNTVYSGTIAAGGQDTYTLTGSAGRLVYFDGQELANSIIIDVQDANNQSVTSFYTYSDIQAFRLPTSGDYNVIARGENASSTGSYRFQAIDLQTAATDLTLSSPVAETLTNGAETVVYSFTGAIGQRLYYDALQNDADVVDVQLISPNGTNVFSGNSESDRNLFTLTEAGTYYLLLKGNNSSSADYSFNLIDASAATAITLGTTVTETLTPGLQADIYRINGTAGQQLYFNSLAETSNATWYLYGPGNQYVAGTSLSSDFETTLTSTGTYLLVLDGSNSNGNINYSFNITSSLSTPTTLTLGTAVTSTISQPGETDEYTFTGAVGQRLYYDGLINNTTSTIYAELISPSGQTVFYNGDADSDRNLFTLTEAGTYKLILDGYTDNTGNYSFNLIDASAATAITLGTTVTETLTPGLQADIYRINGTAGQQLYFNSLAETSNATWYLYGPGNQYVAGTNLSSDFETTLTSTGTYLLVLDGSNSNGNINYSFNITSSLSTPTTLTLGTAVTSTISQPGETDEYTFTGAVGQRLYYDGLINNTTSTIYAELISPSGQTVFYNGDADSDRNLFTLTEAGTYKLILDGYTDNTGNYSFNLIDASAATAITLGTTVTETLTPGLQADIYRINGTAGQQLYFNSLAETSNATWYLYGPGNQYVAGTNLSSDFETTLTSTGTYLLVLDGSNSNGNINYSFNITSSLSTPTTLTLGTAVTSTISQPGETDEYTFTGAVGQRLYYDGLINNTTSTIYAELISPSGQTVFYNGDADSDRNLFTLTEAGTYKLILDGYTDNTGNYSFNLIDASAATAITLGTTVTETLTPGLQADIYRINGTAGQQLYFNSLAETSNATWYLYVPGNQYVAGTNLSSDFETTLTSTGTYLLVLDGNNSNGNINYSFQIYTPETTSVQLGLDNVGLGQRLYTYDPKFNQLTSMTDELGHQTLYEIDSNNGNLLSLNQVVGEIGGDDDIVTKFTYTNNGLVDLITDPLGRITDSDYDANGGLISIIYAKGTADEAKKQLEYDAAGNVTAIIDENGNRTKFEYDALNRLVKTVEADPDGAGPLTSPVTTYSYDARGNLISTTDAVSDVTQNSYDNLNRLIENIDALNQKTTYSYDKLGNLLSVVDPLGNKTENKYDARNRVFETIAPDLGSTKFTYDLSNNLASVTDPVNNETTFVYDARNRLISETDPLGKTSQYQYDAVNNLIAKTDRNNRNIEYKYDDINRRITETWVGNNEVINYSYDKASNQTAVNDKFSSLAFTYDNRDSLLSVNNAGTPGFANVLLNYGYDKVGNVLSVADKINNVAGGNNSYSYDALNRLTKLTQSGNGVSDKRVDFGYNSLGQYTSINRYANLTGTQLVNGTTYSYDSLNRLTNLNHSNGTNNVAFYNYVYDVASRITKITDVDGATDYTYDNRAQLTGANHSNANNPDETYTYDANGNRITSSIHGNGYVTGQGNRLLSDGKYNYEYDNEGNLTKQTDIATGKVQELTWDYRNRLVAFVDKDAVGKETQRVEFTYDAFNRRIAKAVDTNPQDTTPAVVTQFIYDRSNVLLEFVDSDGAGANQPVLDKRYLYGAGVDHVLAEESTGGNVVWQLTDRLGSVRDLVNNSGAVVNHLVYDSFGQVISKTNPTVDTRYLFTGREFDQETGLYYYRARYYDQTTGRFLSGDPIGFASGDSNKYRYVNNNPVNNRDPIGLYAGLDDAIFAGGGALVGLLGQGLGDLISGNVSDWEDYAAAAIGGAAGGEALLYTGPVGAGAIGGAVTNLTKQGLKNLTGKQCGFDTGSFAIDTGIGAATGFIPGIKVPGITSGRGSYNAVYKQITTKFSNGTISNITLPTAGKMFVGRAVDTSLLPGAGAGAAAGVAASSLNPSNSSCSCK